MGCKQGEQPALREEGIRPALMVGATSEARLAPAFAQDAPQSRAHPLIERSKRRRMAVLEISIPAAQRPVQVRDNDRETLPVGTPGLGTQRVLQLVQALSPGPSRPPCEVIAQKVEATRCGGVHDPRLRRMQLQSRRSGPTLHPFQRLAGFRLVPAQNHEVVRVPHHLESRRGHEVVERVEIDIGQQRADDGLNAKDNFQFERTVRYRWEGNKT